MDNVKTDQLGLIVLSNIEEVGKKTNEYLKMSYRENKDYMKILFVIKIYIFYPMLETIV